MPSSCSHSTARSASAFQAADFWYPRDPQYDGTAPQLSQRCQVSLQKQRHTHGAIAQLGERIHGMDEVVGSIPTSSTTSPSARVLRSPPECTKRCISRDF